MKGVAQGTRRYFFAPTDDGAGWVLVEALGTHEGWEVRQAAKLGMRLLPEVPPPGGDWVEVRPPMRSPKPKPPKARPVEEPEGPAPTRPATSPPSVKPAKSRKAAKPAPGAAPRRARPPVPPEKLPGLSQELGALLADAQKRQKAPEGMVKCPVCGLPLQPTRNKRVRTHDDPLKASRCEASNRPWAEFAS